MQATAEHHQTTEEPRWPASYPASVVVEVGPGRGALVLYADPALLGTEVEVGPVSEPTARTHTAIRERLLPDGTVCAALFGSLAAGEYVISGTDQRILVVESTVGEAVLETIRP